MTKNVRFWLIVAIALVIVLVGIPAMLFRPVSFHVESSADIAAPAQKVFAAVADFKQWAKWSPWIVLEPGVEVTISGDGKSVGNVYAWDGQVIGKGELEHKAVEAPRLVRQELRFEEPHESTATVDFSIEPAGEKASKITWSIDGKMPSVMNRMMSAWIRMDYERGLRMLREYCETGSVLSKTEVEGTVKRPALSYVGLRAQCKISEISDSAEQSYAKLRKLVDAGDIKPTAPPIWITSKFDPADDLTDYTAALPVESRPETLPAGTVFGEMPAHSAFKVVHTGSYDHLGNAWSTAMQHVMSNKDLKMRRDLSPYEVCLTDPEQTPESELRSEILVPLH